MIRSVYSRFLQTLRQDDIPDNVRKIANLVLQNIETLIPLTTAQGNRVRRVVELAQANWVTTSANIEAIEELETDHTFPCKQLKKITVGPFRGFSNQETIDLDSKLVLIYGPNGTGKSSFCEALEYCLLGNVAEAESKRFRNQDLYLKNAHSNTFTAPILTGKDELDNEFPITDNEALFRFCFVEKNRIDNFSHIAAQSPAKQNELISTLFGLDAFSDFVHNFSNTMDERYIDIIGVKAKELSEKREELAGFIHQIETIIPTDTQKLTEDEKTLAETYNKEYTFRQMVEELNGVEGVPGLISRLEDEVQKPIRQLCGLKKSDLLTLHDSISSNITNLILKQKDLNSDSQQISFKQLYEAIERVQENSIDKCPACNTPLSQVTTNPYTNAETELKKLKHLSDLQEEISSLERIIKPLLSKLLTIINTCLINLPESNILSKFHLLDGVEASIDWWYSLHENIEDDKTAWNIIESQVMQLEDIDAAIILESAKRVERKAELHQLRQFSEEIIKLQTRKETINTNLTKAQEAIEQFDTDNAELIAEVEIERNIIVQNQAITSNYSIFVQKLNDYNNNLPSELVADLGEKVVQLYNAFNRHDGQHEQLSVVNLPLSANQKLEISFSNNPDIFYDALHILSEGHIRCLGLAILTAKNIKEECPILIFDDPVNAIDDDHRESIRKTLFEDTHFENKQIILTCHGEEFLKDIQNLLSVERAQSSKTVSFLPKITNTEIRVDQNCAPRNYIIASRNHFDRSEIRDALDKSRKALESLGKGKIWQYVNRYGDGNLSIKMRSANAPIELRNLLDQLKSKISKGDFTDVNKNTILDPIVLLLGIDGNSREWRYLNKGTHEEADRTEFDRGTVNTIITALESIDSTLG